MITAHEYKWFYISRKWMNGKSEWISLCGLFFPLLLIILLTINIVLVVVLLYWSTGKGK